MNGSTLALLALALLGCGGIVNFQKDEGGDGGNGEGGSSPVGPGPGPGSGGGTSAIKPTILGVDLGADCQPEIGPDPINGNVVVNYENEGTGPGSMNIVSAEVTWVTPMEGWVFPLNFNPTTSGTIDPGTTHASQHDKVATAGDSSFVCSLCGQEGTLNLRFIDDQGLESQASSSFALACFL